MTNQNQSNHEEQSQHSYFLMIYAYVADHPEIDDATAMLFGRLNALTNQKGYCWASNKYLADLTGVKEREIKYRLQTLKRLGMIEIDTRRIGMMWERKIWVNRYQKISTTGTPLPFDKAEVCPVEGHQCAPYIDKNTNNINNNNRAQENKPLVAVLASEKITPDILAEAKMAETTGDDEDPHPRALPSQQPLSDVVRKKELLQHLDLSHEALQRALKPEYTIEDINRVVQHIKYKEGIEDINRYFTSALIGRWPPQYPADLIERKKLDDKEKQQQLLEQKKLNENKLKIDQLAQNFQSTPTLSFKIVNGIPWAYLDEGTLLEKVNRIPYTEAGYNYMILLIEKKGS